MAPGWLRPAVCGTYRKDVGSYAAFEVVDTLQLEFRDSLTEMDSRFRGNDGQTATASVKVTCLAEMTSFPRKRESIA